MKPAEPLNGYFVVSHWVLEDPDWNKLTPSAKILYFMLCKHRNRYSGKRRYFTRTTTQLSKDLNMSRATITRAKQELLDAKFIITTSAPYKSTKWELVEQEHLKSLFPSAHP